MKYISLFSGVGAFEKALDRVGIDYELVNFCEFDKYAIKSYCAVHGESEEKNLGDVTKIDLESLPTGIDLVTYGFPCQDISVAGNLKGFEHNGEKTRSGLFFDALKVIEKTKPKVAIAENVKNLTGKRFKKEFEIVLNSLEEAGYNNYWKVLNAKDFGIPQNRERVFIISIRKDVDNGTFEFPKPFELKLRIKDMLESKVDEKYYLPGDKVEKIKNSSFMQEQKRIQEKEVCDTLLARDYKDPKCVAIDLTINNPQVKEVANCIEARYDCGVSNQRSDGTGVMEIGIDLTTNNPKVRDIANTITSREDCGISKQGASSTGIAEIKQVGQLYGTEKEPNPQAGRIYDPDGISPTMDSCSGGNRMPKIITVGNVNPSGNGMNGTVVDEEGLARTVATEKGEGQKVLVRQATEQGYIECEIGGVADLSYPNSKTRRGRVQEGGTVSPAIVSSNNEICRIEADPIIYDDYNSRIRQDQDTMGTLTPNCGASAPRNGYKVIESQEGTIIDDLYANREPRMYEDTAPTLRADRHGLKVTEPFIAASRGRNPENPSDRTPGAPTEQRLEPNTQGISNALTTVQKDNYVVEPELPGAYGRNFGSKGKIQEDVCSTLQAAMGAGGGNIPLVKTEPQIRIRKLTPKECWRLMGFDDEDFEKAEKVNSNTQLYKQAGNSIVVDVLEYIFESLYKTDAIKTEEPQEIPQDNPQMKPPTMFQSFLNRIARKKAQ